MGEKIWQYISGIIKVFIIFDLKSDNRVLLVPSSKETIQNMGTACMLEGVPQIESEVQMLEAGRYPMRSECLHQRVTFTGIECRPCM